MSPTFRISACDAVDPDAAAMLRSAGYCVSGPDVVRAALAADPRGVLEACC